jgi:endonuclease/exonuclease/phosphatase family metal-dependent hydrolase
MKKLILILYILSLSLCAKEFTVASYNVENLFDLKYSGTEYKEYIPHTKANWNQHTYQIKLNHTIKAIQTINADILALQEIESQEVFDALKKALPQYTYSHFVKNIKAPIGLGLLSRFPITQQKAIQVPNAKVNRPIQEVTVQIQNNTLVLLNNHWPSKRQAESTRITYAFALKERIKQFEPHEDYVLLGDFNSNYNELHTIKREKRLNNTYGMTGINHILNTTLNGHFVKKSQLLTYKNLVHYNLWLDYHYLQRFSNLFRGIKNTPDHILIAPALLDEHNISYVNHSFKVIKPSFLYEKHQIKRWQLKKNRHQAKGYSDHLPIVATFSTKKQNKIQGTTLSSIKALYHHSEFNDAIIRATVIYKNNGHAIIKAKNDRAIYLYNCAKQLQYGFEYDLRILRTKEHYGLKEVVKLALLKDRGFNKHHKTLYTPASKIDLLDSKYQNEVITQLQGTYQKGYLHTPQGKIKLYSKDKTLLPKNGQKLTIIKAHLAYFKNKAQLIIYKKSDIKVNF